MRATSTLDATARAGTGKGAARQARRQGLVPGVIYGGDQPPMPINVKFNELLKALKKGKFMSTLHTVSVDGAAVSCVCRAVQRDVVKDLPAHVDFQRLTEKSRIKLFVPVEFLNQGTCPGLKRGGTLNVVRHEVELNVTAGAIPEKLVVDLGASQLNDVVKISSVELPKGVTPTITDRDFVICTIATPSGFVDSEDGEEGEGEAEG